MVPAAGVEQAAQSFSGTLRALSKRETSTQTVCFISFEPRGFQGGIVAAGKLNPEAAARLGRGGPGFVRVDVQLRD